MELGVRIKQARLAAGLSQRQLCGDVITRNMLSQIENGSARPSMDTLRYLAAQLGKPIGYFLDEEQLTPPNQGLILAARQTHSSRVLELLEDYEGPDPVFDPERYLLEVLACLELARQALSAGKSLYAQALLDRAQTAGGQTPYFTEALRRELLLLRFRAGTKVLPMQLPNLEPELLLRASAALEEKDWERAGIYLDSMENRDGQWYFLRGRVWESLGDYRKAANQYHKAESWSPAAVYGALERCYKALDDYKNAYEYACKQR